MRKFGPLLTLGASASGRSSLLARRGAQVCHSPALPAVWAPLCLDRIGVDCSSAGAPM